jgi:lipopolysaccharide transport system permease protein
MLGDKVATKATPEETRALSLQMGMMEVGKAQGGLSVTRIRPTQGLASLGLYELWQNHELLYILVWRDIKVRYKQTALGVIWIVLQPIVSIIVFTLLFGGLLGVPSNGAPYPLFALAALLPWQYFSGALMRASTNLVDNAHVVTKVYFPRLIFPLVGVTAGLVDLLIAFLVFVVLMLYYRVPPTWALLTLPFFTALAMCTALGFGLWLSALNVRYRDIKHLLPFVLQIWMYVTPVIYSSSLIPEPFRVILALNPMTGVVEGFRWALLKGQLETTAPWGGLFLIAIVIMLVVLISGIFYFRNTERTFTDAI